MTPPYTPKPSPRPFNRSTRRRIWLPGWIAFGVSMYPAVVPLFDLVLPGLAGAWFGWTAPVIDPLAA